MDTDKNRKTTKNEFVEYFTKKGASKKMIQVVDKLWRKKKDEYHKSHKNLL